MDYNEIMTKINKGEIDHIYLLYGEERFLIDETVNRIIEKTIGEPESNFNLEVFYAKDTNKDEIMNTIQTLPMFSDKKVVVVKDIHEFRESDEKGLLPYLKSPSDSTCLILTAEKIDRKRKFYSTLAKVGSVVEFKPLYESQTTAWLMQYAQKNKIKITKDAASKVVDNSGNNIKYIVNDIKKIQNYIGDDTKTITLDDINAISGDIKTETIFALTDAIGDRHIKNALKILSNLMAKGEPPQMILAMIIRQFRFIMLAKLVLKNNGSDQDIMQKASVPAFLLKKIKSQAQKFTEEEMIKCFNFILNADIDLKTSDKNPKYVIESLVLDICADFGG